MIKKLIIYTPALLAFLWICGYGAFIYSVTNVSPQKPTYKTDAIIVLTGGNFRIKTGLSLFAAGLSDHLFITGVHKSTTEADILSSAAQGLKMPDCCITLGHLATTTLENAIETKDWLSGQNIKTIRLVTSSYHLARSYIEFTNALENVEIILHPVEETDYKMSDKKFWILTLDEYNKILFRSIVLMFPQKT